MSRFSLKPRRAFAVAGAAGQGARSIVGSVPKVVRVGFFTLLFLIVFIALAAINLRKPAATVIATILHPAKNCTTSQCHDKPNPSAAMYVASGNMDISDILYVATYAGGTFELDFHFTNMAGTGKSTRGVGVQVTLPENSGWSLLRGTAAHSEWWAATGQGATYWNDNWDMNGAGKGGRGARWNPVEGSPNSFYLDFSPTPWGTKDYLTGVNDNGDPKQDPDRVANQMGADTVVSIPEKATPGTYQLVISGIGYNAKGERAVVAKTIQVKVSEAGSQPIKLAPAGSKAAPTRTPVVRSAAAVPASRIKRVPGDHEIRLEPTCLGCHSMTGGMKKIPHQTDQLDACFACHLAPELAAERSKGLGDATFDTSYRPFTNVVGIPLIPHPQTITSCGNCHVSGSVATVPPVVIHGSYLNRSTCEVCHKFNPVPPPRVPHNVGAFECSMCHRFRGGTIQLEANHPAKVDGKCGVCHESAGAFMGEARPAGPAVTGPTGPQVGGSTGGSGDDEPAAGDRTPALGPGQSPVGAGTAATPAGGGVSPTGTVSRTPTPRAVTSPTPSRVTSPTPTATPAANVPAGDEVFSFEPVAPLVGQMVRISVRSAKPYVDVRLDGPGNPQFDGVDYPSAGDPRYVWRWRASVESAGTKEYKFYIAGTTLVKSGSFVVANPPTATPTATVVPRSIGTPLPTPTGGTGFTPTPTPSPGATRTPAPPADGMTTGTLAETHTNTAMIVTASFAGDDNRNSIATLEYKQSVTSTWSLAPDVMVSYAKRVWSGQISGLTEGQSYDVRLTFGDPNGVTGTNPLNLNGVLLPVWSTTAGSATAAATLNSSIVVAAPFAGDANGNGGATVAWRVAGGSFGVPVAMTRGIAQYSYTVNNLAAGQNYEVQVNYGDPDGVNGTRTQTLAGISVVLDSYETNNNPAQAAGLAAGTTITSYVSSSGDVDYFRFNVDVVTNTVRLFVFDLPANLGLFLERGDGVALPGTTVLGPASNVDISYIASSSGAYYVRVYSVGGSFSSSPYRFWVQWTGPPPSGLGSVVKALNPLDKRKEASVSATVVDQAGRPISATLLVRSPDGTTLEAARGSQLAKGGLPIGSKVEVNALTTDGASARFTVNGSWQDNQVTLAQVVDNPTAQAPPGLPVRFYEVHSVQNAYSQVEVTFSYDTAGAGDVNPNSLYIYHFDGKNWVPVPTRVDRLARTVTGIVDSLSPFVVTQQIGTLNMATTQAVGSTGAGPHGNYTAVTDACAGCHRTHTAAGSSLLVVNSTTTNRAVFCFTCHGSTGMGGDADVEDGVFYTGRQGADAGGDNEAPLKAGGFMQSKMSAAITNTAGLTGTTSSHDVVGTPLTLWGAGPVSPTSQAGTAGFQLTCTNCHDPHGNGNYRLLRPQPIGSDQATPITISDEITKIYSVSGNAGIFDYYDEVQSRYGAELKQQTSIWCASCHTRHLNQSASSGNSGDAVYAYRHNSNGVSAACLTCHVAHGSAAATGPYSSAMSWPDGSGPRGSDGNLLRLDNRGVCQSCHNK